MLGDRNLQEEEEENENVFHLLADSLIPWVKTLNLPTAHVPGDGMRAKPTEEAIKPFIELESDDEIFFEGESEEEENFVDTKEDMLNTDEEKKVE